MKEVLSVITFNLKSLRNRAGGAIVIVIGIAVVSAVLCGALAIADGYRHAFATIGHADIAMVVSPKAESELNSRLSQQELNAIKAAPGVAHNDSGPVVAPELISSLKIHYRGSGMTAQMLLRGINSHFRQMHPKVRLVAGRWFKPGVAELVVGQGAAARFKHVKLGGKITQGSKTWTIVGIFSAAGAAFGSEAWTGIGDVQDATDSANGYSAAFVRLTSPTAFGQFKQALANDPQLAVKAWREQDFYANQSSGLAELITKIGGIAALLMGIAAIFGAMSTLYTAIANRSREIATLRAIGFRRRTVLAGVLAESLALALLGGIIGAALTYAFLNGFHASTLATNGHRISNRMPQVGFAFAVTFGAMGLGVAWALVMGFIGGLFPAIRAARLPVATALRET